jgi:conserved oligomeric Golgi complex subunit 6
MIYGSQLQAARDAAATQTALLTALQEQISIVREDFAAIAEAGSKDQEALLKARADLEVFKTESDAIIAAQTKALEGATERSRTLESDVEKFAELSATVEQLKKEKEEAETRLSEVEIEILENRESLEMAGEEQEKALARLKAFEWERVAAEEASAAAAEASRLKEEEHAAVLESLKELGGQVATARENYEALQAHSQAKEVEHAQTLAEVQRLHEESIKVAAEEMQRIKADLEVFIPWHLLYVSYFITESRSQIYRAIGRGQSRACKPFGTGVPKSKGMSYSMSRAPV